MYEQHFGLRAKPFQLNPDPEFFFGSKGHRRALAYLEYGLHQGEGFIVLTGDVGAGKTTLLQGLMRRLPSDSIVAGHIVTTQLDADDLIRMVAASFGMPIASGDKAELLTRLKAHLEGLHASGKRALLIVDEAQNLSARAVEELRMLSNFQVGTRSLVQSFLVGQPEFRQVMQRPEMQQLKQRVLASYHLGPLDPSETAAYVEHRLTHVGWKHDPSFDAEAFARIHEVSDGVPRRINTLCDRLLLGAFLADRHALSRADVDEVAAEIAAELGSGASPSNDDMPAGGAHPTPGGEATALADLERRVAVVEASTSMIFSVLKRVLSALRGPRQPAPREPAETER